MISGDRLEYIREVNLWNVCFHSLEESCMKQCVACVAIAWAGTPSSLEEASRNHAAQLSSHSRVSLIT